VKVRAFLACAGLAGGSLCLWAFFATEGPAPARETLEAASSGEPAALAPILDGGDRPPAEVVLASGESGPARNPKARVTAAPPPPPDALVAVRGRVLDVRTGEPVAGITLRLLSRRPRTCTVRTDEGGFFATGLELSTGVVTASHVPDPASSRFAARFEIEPTSFLASLPAGTGDPPKEVVLRARAPERELAVDVRLPDDGPAAGAAVSLVHGARDVAGSFRPLGRAYEDTDEHGRALFALFGPDAWERSFRIEAEHGGTLVSELLELDPPLGRAVPVLGLHPASLLKVRATNDEGRPVACVSLWVEIADGTGPARGRAGDTDARGECVFTALRSGCYSVTAVHPSTGAVIRREVDLGRGAQGEVDFHLTLAGLRLRLAGTVVDEFAYPLPGVAVRAQAGGEDWVSLTSGEGGRFEFWGRPCDGVLFSAGGGFLDDRYDPELLSVPCGSSGLVVRRTAKLEERTWPFLAVDRESGEPVAAASVTLHQGAADVRGASAATWQSFTASAGLVQLAFKERPDLAFAVDAPGYLREQGLLRDLVASAGGAGLLRVELERGFDRRIEVRDRVTRRGLAFATVSCAGVVLGRADEHGAVRVRAETWPASLRVEAAGYAPASWDPVAAGFPGEVVWLEPIRAGG